MKSMFIDFTVAGAIAMVLMVVLFLFVPLPFSHLTYYYLFVMTISYSVFFCKDIQGGRSIGKRLLNLQVVSDNSHPLHLSQLILRNIFIFIWPIEILMCIINPEKRLGDLILKTKVTSYSLERPVFKIKTKTVIFTYIIVFLISLLIFSLALLLLNIIFPKAI